MDSAKEVILESYVLAYDNVAHYQEEMTIRLNHSLFESMVINKLLDFYEAKIEAERELFENGLSMNDVFQFMKNRAGGKSA